MIIDKARVLGNGVNVKTHKKITEIIKNILDIKVVPYVLVLFLIASVNILGAWPLAYVMLGVAVMFKIPLLLPLGVTVLSFVVFKSPSGVMISYAITHVIYATLTAIITVEGISKRYITFIKLLISAFIGAILSLCIYGFHLDNIYMNVINLLLIAGMYPVFICGCNVLFNFTKKIMFSKEEMVSFLIVVSMILMPFASMYVYGISIVKALILLFIVIIGWQNDWLIGSSTGVIIGLIFAIITGDTTFTIVTFFLSGLISGLLNRFNKYILALCFAVGNIVLLKVFSGSILAVNVLIEYMIVCAVILIIPNKVLYSLQEIFNQGEGLKEGYQNRLGPANDIRNRLGAIGEVLDNLANLSMPVTDETKNETAEVIKKYILDYKSNECVSCKQRQACLKDEIDIVAKHISTRLEEGKPITREMIPVECSLSEEMVNSIQDIYNNMKLMRIIQIKENEANQKMAEEYKSISSVIKGMSKEMDLPKKADTKEQKLIREDLKFMGYIIYEDFYVDDENGPTYEFITDILTDIDKAKADIQKVVSDALHNEMKIKLILNSSKTEKSRVRLIPSNKYIANTVVRQVKKTGSEESGDSYIVTELKDNSKIFVISDGMGTGAKSKEVSNAVIDMIKKLTSSGVEKDQILNIINSVISFRENKNVTASLDMCVLNESKDTVEFIKIGGAKSFIIKDGKVEVVSIDNMPLGAENNINYYTKEIPVSKNMYIILTSDGVASDIDEKVIEKILQKKGNNITEIDLIDEIMGEIVGTQNKVILDDITVLVCKLN